ncbi:hypothetical protein IWQ61_001805 [Dispira simplex]|nr:hypothetical protein IWQ61_001805 [Dispira simplex]
MTNTPFPVKFRQAQISVQGHPTEIITMGFSNRLVVLVTQLGNLGTLLSASFDSSTSSYPLPLLGETGDITDTTPPNSLFYVLGRPNDTVLTMIYQQLATHILGTIHQSNPNDRRPLLLGISLKDHKHLANAESGDKHLVRATLDDLAAAVQANQVW